MRLLIPGMMMIAVLGLTGCGGGSSSGGSGGMDDITWPDRDGGTTSELPPAVKTGRVVFRSETGQACCVAVNPSLLSGDAQRGLAILNNLLPGKATVTVAGFATGFAPLPSDIVMTEPCDTVPANAAQPCDPERVASPAFESPPLEVIIVAGEQTNIPDVPMEAFPFLFGFSPAQNATAPAPVQFDLTVVDAATNVREDSVQLEVSFTMPDENAAVSGSPFRTLTKRVELNLTRCEDGTSVPCNPTANLQLAGFAATGTAPELPEGPVEAHVTAANLGNPPRELDFRYSFMVLATPTATATATETAVEGAAPAAPVAGGENSASSPPTATPGADGAAPSRDADGAANARGADSAAPSKAAGPFNVVPPTPTATPASGGVS